MVNWAQVLEAGAAGLRSVGTEAKGLKNAYRIGESGLTTAAEDAANIARGGLAHDGLPIPQDLRADYANDLMAKAQADSDAFVDAYKKTRGIPPETYGADPLTSAVYTAGRQPARAWDMVASHPDVVMNGLFMAPMIPMMLPRGNDQNQQQGY